MRFLRSILMVAILLTSSVCFGYEVFVGRVQVTSSNASHVTGSGITGNISYNASTNTLTLDHATIEGAVGINCNYSSNLTIILVGTNTINAVSVGIWTTGNCTIQGGFGNTLNIDAGHEGIWGSGVTITGNVKTEILAGNAYPAVYAYSCSISGVSTEVYAQGSTGFERIDDLGFGGTLSIDKSTVSISARDTEKSAIYGFGAVSCTDCSITYPSDGGIYDQTQHRLEKTNGSALTNCTYEERDCNLWIMGTRLPKNGNIICTPFNGGIIEYNFSTKTLSMDNVTCSYAGAFINSYIPNLTIVVTGTNKITSTLNDVFSFNSSTTITGTGSLSLTSQAAEAIYCHNLSLTGSVTITATTNASRDAIYSVGDLTIGNKSLTVRAPKGNGIRGYGNVSMAVYNGARVDISVLHNSTHGVIYNFKHLYLSGVSVTYPNSTTYDENALFLKRFVDPVTDCMIEPENTNLWVAGHRLKKLSGDTYTFSNLPGINGYAVYYFSSNTLFLNNTAISTPDHHAIQSYIPGLTIHLSGTNIIATSGYGFNGIDHSSGALTIRGTGNLLINAQGYGACAIYCATESLSIQGGCTVSAISSADNSYAIACPGTINILDYTTTVSATATGSNSCGIYNGLNMFPLNISDATVKAKGTSNTYGAIYGFSGVNLTRAMVTEPFGASYDLTDHRMETSGGSLVKDCTIESNQQLYVAGQKLPKGSGTYTFDASGISQGSVEFNYSTKTLTLTGAIISYPNTFAIICSGIEDLKIKLVGNNNIISAAGIYSANNITFMGTGNLTNTADDNGIRCQDLRIEGGCHVYTYSFNENASATDRYAIRAHSVVITGAGTTVTAQSRSGSGIKGDSSGSIKVAGAKLDPSGLQTDGGAISGFGYLVLTDGASITNPIGGKYNTTTRRMETSSGTTLRACTIEAYNHQLWVAGYGLDGINNTFTFTGTGINGSVVYTHSNNTLTLTNATISSNSYYPIENHIPGLTIKFVGTNTVSTTTTRDAIYSEPILNINCSGTANVSSIYNAISSYSSLNITGDGTLNATSGVYEVSTVYAAIWVAGSCTITGSNLKVNATVPSNSNHCGIYSHTGSTLSINGSTVVAKGNNLPYGCIGGFNTLSLTNVDILSPRGAIYNTSSRFLKLNNSLVTNCTIGNMDYDLWVNGIQVKTSNLSNVTGDGTVSYNASSKTLTLNNANIQSGSKEGIQSKIDSLIINLVGQNTVRASNNVGLDLGYSAPTTIRGTGSLNVSGYHGIYMCSNLTITGGCEVTATATRPGSYASIFSTNGKTLTINASTLCLNAFQSSCGVISGTSAPSLQGNAKLIMPYGYTWNSSHSRYENTDGNPLIGYAKITPNHYNLYVAGRIVSDNNKNDILEDGGSVIYDPVTHVLGLNNATIQNLGSNNDGIQINNDDIIINLNGTNTINSGDDGIQLSVCGTTIRGSGSLVINSAYGIYCNNSNNKTLSFTNNCNVTINASTTGINFTSGTLVVNNATVKAKGTTLSIGCQALQTTGVSILSPEGAYQTGNIIAYQGTTNKVKGEYVVIGPQPYDLWVKGTQVNALNKDDILNNGGKVKYDPANNVLTLNNASISNSSGRGIENKVSGLTINLIGSNTITANSSGIYSNQDFTINGRGTLNVTGSDGIYASSCNLTIDGGCTITTTSNTNDGDYAGIYGSSNKHLYINRSKVTANHTSYPPILNIQPVLTGCMVTYPAGAIWDDYESCYVNPSNGQPYANQIIISPIDYNIMVAGIHVTSANCDNVLGSLQPTVTYDPTTNELTLNNASINTNDNSRGIYINRSGVKINLIGEINYINASSTGIFSNNSFTIQGTGRLRIWSEETDGIYAKSDLTIQGGCCVEVVTYGEDCAALTSDEGDLMINGSRLVAENESYHSHSAINSFNDVIFEDNLVQFIEPEDGYYYHYDVRESDGYMYTGQVVIDGASYGLSVNGKPITSANCENFQYGVKSGQVSYNPSTHTLYLDNAWISDMEMGVDVISNESLSELNIVLIGETYIEVDDPDDNYAFKNYQEDARISISSDSDAIEYGELWSDGSFELGSAASLYIGDGCTVGLYSENSSLYGNSSMDLTVSNAILYAYTIEGVGDLSGDILEPLGAELNNHQIEYYGQLAEEVIIGTSYDILVADTPVTSENADNITSTYLTQGTVRYDFSSNTLTLSDVSINYSSAYSGWGIEYQKYTNELLNIELIGENEIYVPTCGISALYSGVHFTGNGSLIIVADAGVEVATNVVVSDACKLYISSKDYALYGFGTLQINSSDNFIQAYSYPDSQYSTIHHFSGIEFNGVEFLQPFGVYYSTTNRQLEVNGEAYNNIVEIGYETYSLWINDEAVTSVNAAHFVDQYGGIEGNVSYDHFTNTLTLENAVIGTYSTGQFETGIWNRIDGLTIYLIGDNRIGAWSEGIFTYESGLTITGPGTLTIEDGDLGIWGHSMDYKSIIISDGCVVDIKDGGLDVSSGTLVIDNATLKSVGEGGSVTAGNLQLDYVAISSPTGAVYDENNGYIEDASGNVINTQVIIEPIIYDLKVKGIQVTAVNAGDILGDGTISYIAEQNQLVLNGTNFYEGALQGIFNNIPNLAIVLVGENEIDAYNIGIYSEANLIIEGDGTLNLSTYMEGIRVCFGGLTIQGGCTINSSTSSSNYPGMYCCSGHQLTINKSYVNVQTVSTTHCAISGFGEMVLNGVAINTPVGGYYDNRAVYSDDDELYYGPVEIGEMLYDLWIAGVQVTSINADDVLGDGTVSYNDAIHELILNETAINYNDLNGAIKSNIEDLNIVLIGTNSITTGYDAIDMSHNLTISGTGVLNIDASYGIISNYSSEEPISLTLDGGCTVNVEAVHIAVSLDNENTESGNFTINSSTFTATNSNGYDVRVYCDELVLNGSVITTPSNGLYSSSDGKFLDQNYHDGISHVVISIETYPLWVGGVQVNAHNAIDVFNDGTVSFDPSTYTLTLNNADIEYLEDPDRDEPDGITFESLDHSLILNLVGSSTIHAGDDGINYGYSASAFITGNGTLNITAPYGIYAEVCDLFISGGNEITITAQEDGIYADKLSVDKSTLKVTGNAGSITAFDLNLIGTVITKPSGAEWNEDNGRIENNGHTVTSEVIISIENYPLWVVDKQVNAQNASDILGDGGSISYSANTKTLTLHEVEIDTAVNNLIRSEVDEGLTIKLEGNNSIKNSEWQQYGILLVFDATITGYGSLYISADYGIRSNPIDGVYPSLTITDYANITIDGTIEGVNCGYSDLYTGGVLTIESSKLDVTIPSNYSGVAVRCKNLNLTYTEVTEPAEYIFDEYSIKQTNNYFAKHVVIDECNIFTRNDGYYWSTVDNWSKGELPLATSKVFIRENCTVDVDAAVKEIVVEPDVRISINNSHVLDVDTIVCSQPNDVLINRGGELFNHKDVLASSSISTTSWDNGGGWYLVALPASAENLSSNTLLSGIFDLYRYNEANQNEQEWENYQSTPFDVELGRGYLYARENKDNPTFKGTINSHNVTRNLTYTTPQNGYPLAGFNLIGNPFAHSIYKGQGASIDNSHLAAGYYILNNGTWQAQTDDTPIGPNQAVLVRTDATTNLTIVNTMELPSTSRDRQSTIRFSVSGNETCDQAFITLGNANGLAKVSHVDDKAAMLYFDENEAQYAILSRPTVDGEYRLCFKAGEKGTYTLKADNNNLNIILVDTLTNQEVELTEEGYSFLASPDDSVDRFIVIVK